MVFSITACPECTGRLDAQCPSEQQLHNQLDSVFQQHNYLPRTYRRSHTPPPGDSVQSDVEGLMLYPPVGSNLTLYSAPSPVQDVWEKLDAAPGNRNQSDVD